MPASQVGVENAAECLAKHSSYTTLLSWTQNWVQFPCKSTVWAKKGSDDQRIFAIHADQYLPFTTAVVAIQESAATQSEQSARVIALANEFAAGVSNGYSVQELDKLDHDVDLLSQSLVTAMFSRIARRLAKVTESY